MPTFTDILRTALASGQSGVIRNLLEGTQMSSTKNGLKYIDRLVAVGLSGDCKLYSALQIADIPKLRDPHPQIQNLFVTEVNYSYVPDYPTASFIDVVYERPTRSTDRNPSDSARPSIEISTTLVTESTNYDNTGSAIEVFRQNKFDPSKPTVQPVVVQIQVPQLTVRLTRKEPNHPLYKGLQYSGRVNKTDFLGKPPRTWLCGGIDTRSVDAGESYECTYTFTYRERDESKKKVGWDKVCYFTEGGLPIASNADPKPLEGYEFGTFEILPEADFTDLKIDIGGGGNNANYVGGGFTGI